MALLLFALGATLFSHASAATPAEWRTRSIYQILTDRFAAVPTPQQCTDLGNYCGGTWAGITAHLDYVQQLGFDAIWISPVVDNAEGGYHGYWQRRMDSPNSHFGSGDDLRALSSSLHARGMLLMVDVVANHASSNGDVSQNFPFSSPSDYHNCSGCSGCNVNDYTNLAQMEHCRLAGLMDFDQTDPTSANAEALYAWVSALVSNYSIDGLRVDTTPYVPPAFWRRFEASAGVYAVGEVDSSDVGFVAPWQAPSGRNAALSGVLSYPLFWTLRNVFKQRGSMRELGDAWRAGNAAFADVGLLGTFTDNHDNPRTLNGGGDVGAYRGALAYALLSEGIPITYYGSEWLYSGGGDPGCREPLWNPGISYDAAAAPLGRFLNITNAWRRSARLWDAPQIERWQDDTFYAFSRGSNLVCTTNVGASGSPQSRAVTFLPAGWSEGTRACNAYACSQCATVTGGAFVTPPLAGADGVAAYDPTVRC